MFKPFKTVYQEPIRFVVCIPTLNRADLLNEALVNYFTDFKETLIVICDNGNQEIIKREQNFVILRPETNLGVSKSWNLLMEFADKQEATHVLMLNDDIYLGKSEIQIQSILQIWKNMAFINSYQNWSSFILTVQAWKEFGKFDENIFPAYFEDNDAHYRMKLLNMNMVNTEKLNPVTFRNSMTIEKDASLNENFLKNRTYYIKKWGGAPNKEKYLVPFNAVSFKL
jgi:glycosyltransferase involved in cell wall biosynthesis